MRKTLLILSLVSALVLAGCASPSETPDSTPAAKTYSVPIEAGHAVNGAARTIKVVVTQAGAELGSGSYQTAGKTADQFVELFKVNAKAGQLKLQAFEGSNPLNFKVIDPAKCSEPNFQIHVVDGTVHLWSNCD